MFNEKYNNRVEMFDLTHIFTLLFMLLVTILVVRFAVKNKSLKKDKIFRITLASILLMLEVVHAIWKVVKGEFDYTELPIWWFCSTTNFITIYYLYKNDKKVASIAIYYAFTGALFSLIFISMSYGPPHFRYFNYFYVHFGFLLAAIYFLMTKRIQIDLKTFIRSCIYLFSYTIVILIMDIILEANHFYLFESPVKEISDFFGIPLYTIFWLITIFILNTSWYLLISFIQNKKLNYLEISLH